MKRILSFLVFSVFLSADSTADGGVLPPFINEPSGQWADSVISGMSASEKIAQLIMVAAWSNKDSAHIREIDNLIKDWHIGGLIFFQGGPVRQAMLTNHYQSISKTPLMIGIDGEWGVSMRLDSTLRYPRQMTLAANPDDSAVYRMGKQIAAECKRLGVHINFAPDADINSNPANPVIGSRSFSDEREEVASRAIMYMKGMQDNGILASGKHFPGHGDADMDSHYTLPVINKTRSEMDTMELYPFRKLIDQGLASTMVAHLRIPSLDTNSDMPSTLSRSIITDLLKQELGFKGLVFTDALNMKAVSEKYRPGNVECLALLAGNDILLYSEDVPRAISMIQEAVSEGKISQDEIDARVRKVLMAKHWCGLNKVSTIDTSNLIADLNNSAALYLQQDLFEHSITILKNEHGLLPLKKTDKKRIAFVSVGALKNNEFQDALSEHIRGDLYAIEKDAPSSAFQSLLNFLRNYDLVVLSLHGTTMRAQSGYGITDKSRQFIESVIRSFKTVFVDFGNPYTLSRFRSVHKASAIVLGYEDFRVPMVAAAQLIAGAATTEARLPVTVPYKFSRGAGVSSNEVLRLKRTFPEELGIPSFRFAELDSIVHSAIDAGAMPGCQVLVAKDGKIVYEKAFGFQTWDSSRAVRTDDIYDVASITKVAATALSVMKGYDNGYFKLNEPLSTYYTRLSTTDKKDLTVLDVLTHQSGLEAWIPFWKKTFTGGTYTPGVYSQVRSDEFPWRIADSLYLRNDYQDSLQQWVFDSPLENRGKYVYSDLGPIMLRWASEEVSGKAFEKYLEDEFYHPLQLGHSGFRPHGKFETDRIVPTEYDTLFRHQLLRGDVHDPAAAFQGGVSGNAGLFSNAYDLAVIFQMLLKRGWYGGEQLISPATVNLFTAKPLPGVNSRRGLLFDKPEMNRDRVSPTCTAASAETFGHLGYTGTCVWADPKRQLIFVFLSNRVHPRSDNEKLIKLRIRPNLQKAAYDALNAD